MLDSFWETADEKLRNRDMHLEQMKTEWEQKVNQIHNDVKKHNLALEDLFDEWENKSTSEETLEREHMERLQQEKNFLALFEAYLDQFFSLKRFAGKKDMQWEEQMELMEVRLRKYQELCNIMVIEPGEEPVDYDFHEVIQLADTEDPSLDQKTATVLRCGYLYKGEVKRKAQVSVYRLRKEREANE